MMSSALDLSDAIQNGIHQYHKVENAIKKYFCYFTDCHLESMQNSAQFQPILGRINSPHTAYWKSLISV